MYEQYHQLFYGNTTLRPLECFDFTFELCDEEISKQRYRLFFKGESQQFYYFKSEPKCIYNYLSIDDALDMEHAQSSAYCLDFSCKKPVNYTKGVRNHVLFEPLLGYLSLTDYEPNWKAGLRVKAENLVINESIELALHVRMKDSTTANHDFSAEPDYIKTIPITSGTYDWTTIEADLLLPPGEVASVTMYIEGKNYSGNLYLESPYLISSNGYNAMPDFAPTIAGYDEIAWIGMNLSKKEWPEFELSINDEVFYTGSFFERCHRQSEIEKNIPNQLLKVGKNHLCIRLISEGRESLPFVINELGLLSYENAPFNIVGFNPDAIVGNDIPILIRTTVDNCTLKLASPNSILRGETQGFDSPGLHVFHATALTPATDISFTLSCGEYTCASTIRQSAVKLPDEVIVGSGDMVYVNSENKEELETFLCWYISQNVGNLLTIRPCYRWCGNRSIHEENWQWFTSLLNELGIKYSHMLDGRELPGLTANPTINTINGKGFLGRQLHERDGAYSYWGFQNQINNPLNAKMYAWMVDLTKQQPKTANPLQPNELIAEEGAVYRYLSPKKNNIGDMRLAAENLIQELAYIKRESTRHTGPSTYFKYFIQAGYEMVGAETMYGPTEILLAFLRGVSRSYELPTDSVHLAMQWSTVPHDTPEHEKRFRLALYVPYMQGIKEINTEEGLWHIEEFYSSYSRMSACCMNHLKHQQDFMRYISTHTRRGSYYTPFAFISGRYDDFRSFGRANVMGTTMNVGAPEQSWKLLQYFYPLTDPSGTLYYTPAPVKPLGFHSGTPRGNVDVLPIESASDKFTYKAMFFAGYNCALKEDMDKLLNFVSNGGKLLAGMVHFSTSTNRNDIEAGNHQLIEHPLTSLVKDLPPSENLVKIPIGKGYLYYVNSNLYPADEQIAPIYEKAIAEITTEILAQEDVYITCPDTVQFTVYDSPDGMRDFYIMATDWYHEDSLLRQAVLSMNGKEYSIDVPANTLLKITVKDGTAAWAEGENGEILSIEDGTPSFQGYGTVTFHIIKDGIHTTQTIHF